MFKAASKKGRILEVVSEEKKDSLLRSLEMDRSSLERDVAAIRTWLSKQHHLPPVDSDELIKAFIIGCKGSLEKSKKKLDAYYSVRSLLPEIFLERDPCSDYFQQFIDKMLHVTLPRLTEDGCRLHILWVTTPDANNYDVTAVMQKSSVVMDINIQTEPYVTGDYAIISCQNFSLGQLAKFKVTDFRNIFFLTQKVYPMRLKGVFLIYAPSIMNTFVNNLIKPVISKKLADRFIVTSEGSECLHKYFKKEILPKDFGGDEVDLNTLKETWNNKIMAMRDCILEEFKLVTKEELRPKETKRDDLYGMEGTFRKLNID